MDCEHGVDCKLCFLFQEIVKASTKFTLRGLQPSSKYKVLIRVKPDNVTYDGYWSAWSDPEFGTTPPSGKHYSAVL